MKPAELDILLENAARVTVVAFLIEAILAREFAGSEHGAAALAQFKDQFIEAFGGVRAPPSIAPEDALTLQRKCIGIAEGIFERAEKARANLHQQLLE